jgi:hypothetical protein
MVSLAPAACPVAPRLPTACRRADLRSRRPPAPDRSAKVSAERAVGTRGISLGETVPPRVAFDVVRALEDVLLAPMADAQRVREAIGAIERALLVPRPDEFAVLGAVRRLEEAVHAQTAEQRRGTAPDDHGRPRGRATGPGPHEDPR